MIKREGKIAIVIIPRKITSEMGEKFRKDNYLDFFIESSAKTGFNTKKIFKIAAQLLYDDHVKYKDQIERRVNIKHF